MKYVVIEYRNPVIDVCAHHPSQIATMLDGSDLWPVTATCVSRSYDTHTEALERLKQLFAERGADLDNRVCKPWEIFEVNQKTLCVGELDAEGFPEIDTSEWVCKMEVVGIPETDEEAELT